MGAPADRRPGAAHLATQLSRSLAALSWPCKATAETTRVVPRNAASRPVTHFRGKVTARASASGRSAERRARYAGRTDGWGAPG